MTDPKLELKSVKVHQAMSEETLCFSATIYVDGKQAGTVTNRGQGGCHEYRWNDKATGERVAAWAKTQKLPFDFEHLDQVLGNMISLAEAEAQLKRSCRKNTLYRFHGDPPGSWRMLGLVFSEEIRGHLSTIHGDQLEAFANVDIRKAAKLSLQGGANAS